MVYNFDDFLENYLTQYVINIGIQLILMFNIIKTHMGVNYNKLYNNNELFHKCIDTMHVNSYYLKNLVLPYYIEPPFSYFKVCYKDRTYKEQYMNVDSILYDTNTATTLSGMISTYKNIFSVIKPIIKHNELEYLVLLHYRNLTDDYIMSRLMYDSNDSGNKCEEVCDVQPTRNYFLSVEYSHPTMETTISLNLDKRYLITGNELFSPCFVLKCLNYQKEPYVFDKSYSLSILDSDIKNITIGSSQYIRLTGVKYEVIEIKSNNKID